MAHPETDSLKSAFKLGYVLTLINNELEDEEEDVLWNFLYLFKSAFRNDYALVMNEELLMFPTYRDIYDITDYFRGLYEAVKEELAKNIHPFIELSFLIGGLVAISYSTDEIMMHKTEIELAYSQVLQLSNMPFSKKEISRLVDKLDSYNLHERMQTRIKLFHKINESNPSDYQVEVISYLDELIAGRA